MVGNIVAVFPFIRWPNNVLLEIPYTGTSPLWYLADRLIHRLFFFLAICPQNKRRQYQVPAILLTAKREGCNKLTFRAICLL
jgi:hypothetical protein